jgi:hypothetical protein
VKKAMKAPAKKKASEDEVEKFLRWLAENRDKREAWPSIESERARSALPAEFQGRLPDIVRRFYGDLVRGTVKKDPGRKRPSKRRSSKSRRKRVATKR